MPELARADVIRASIPASEVVAHGSMVHRYG
jgi:hypothetical protein